MLNLLPDPGVRRAFRALLGNTASPTVLRAGNKTNVIPGFAEAEIDGRILPGQTQDDFLRELRDVLGADIELEVMHSLPPVVTEPKESSLYSLIHEVMGSAHPTRQSCRSLCRVYRRQGVHVDRYEVVWLRARQASAHASFRRHVPRAQRANPGRWFGLGNPNSDAVVRRCIGLVSAVG